jgi:GNAT superfamily N-acetyltransferase
MISKIISITPANINEYGLFCQKSRPRSEGYQNKLAWFYRMYAKGLRVRLLLIHKTNKGFRPRGFIEYVPGDYAWRGIRARGWMVIHCIWIIGRAKGKGFGSKLLKYCIRDAKAAGLKGVCIMTSSKGWLPRENLFLKHGFIKADEMDPFAIMARPFSKTIPLPKFVPLKKGPLSGFGRGIVILESHQCPYGPLMRRGIEAAGKKLGVQVRSRLLSGWKEAQARGVHPYGVFCAVYNGRATGYYQGNITAITDLIKSRSR